MHPLTVECYLKPQGANASEPAGQARFSISEKDHRRLEQVEEALQESGQYETIIPVSPSDVHLELPDGVERLEDCKIRVYVRKEDGRGQFHLFGHRAGDHSLFYTNAVMVDAVAA